MISESEQFDTKVEAIAPRIGIDWSPYTNDGPVTFHFEKITTQADGTVLERTFLGVLPARSANCWRGTTPSSTPSPARKPWGQGGSSWP